MARDFVVFSCGLGGEAARLVADGLAVEADENGEGAEIDFGIGGGLKGLSLEEGGGGGLGGLGILSGEIDQAGEGRGCQPLFVVAGEGANVGLETEADWRRGGGELNDFTIGVVFQPIIEFCP